MGIWARIAKPTDSPHMKHALCERWRAKLDDSRVNGRDEVTAKHS